MAVVSCFGKTQNLIFQFKIWAYFSRKKSPCQGKEFFVEKMPLLSRVQGDVGEVVCHEIHLVHGPHPAVEAGQTAGIGGEAEGQLVGAEGLAPGAAVLFVLPGPAVFPVPQQGMAGGGELGPDLVGAAGDQAAGHQGQAVFLGQGLVEGHGGAPAGDGGFVDGDQLFGLVLEQIALQPARGGVMAPKMMHR